MAREDSVFSADSSKLKSIGMRLRQLSDGICDGTGLPVTCLGTVRLVLPFSPFSVCLLQCALVPHGNESLPQQRLYSLWVHIQAEVCPLQIGYSQTSPTKCRQRYGGLWEKVTGLQPSILRKEPK